MGTGFGTIDVLFIDGDDSIGIGNHRVVPQGIQNRRGRTSSPWTGNSSYGRRLLCSIQYPQRRTPKGVTKNEAGYPAGRFSYQKGGIRAHRVGIGVSVEELSFEAPPPSRAVFRRGDVFMDNKLGSDRGSHCSKSARQHQHPKRLTRVQPSTRAEMLRGPSKKRPTGARPPVGVYPVFYAVIPLEPNVPPLDSTHI